VAGNDALKEASLLGRAYFFVVNLAEECRQNEKTRKALT
jgi:hypothetical protein